MANVKRAVRMKKFREQIAERVIGPDRLVPLELSDGRRLTMKIPLMLADDDPMVEEMEDAVAAKSSMAMALAIFSGNSAVSAEDQLAAYLEVGDGDLEDLLMLWRERRAVAEQALSDFRYSG